MLLDMLLRATQPAPDTLLGRILRTIDRHLRRSAEMEARMAVLRPAKGLPGHARMDGHSVR